MAPENHPDPPSHGPGLLEHTHSIQPTPGSPELGIEATGIIDREADLAAVSSLLLGTEVRLLTLTGPAGVGKTRLAREVGRHVTAHFPQGVVFVDLAPIRDPALILPTLGQQLGVLDAGSQPLSERLQAYLSDREMLLILDNLEQVLPADVGLEALLETAPRLTMLVTSREPLHLLWEQLYHVPPLALPDPEHLPTLEELARVPSVALFLRRAHMIDPSFRLTDENARAIAELCVHLDGLPLAIKLAAARTQLLSPQMLLERLGQRLSLLHWEAQDLPERQHTLGAAIAWSYDQLSPQEQALFRSLGVFVGAFTLEAAEAVAARAVPRPIDVLEGLSTLVDKSLVQREDDGQGGYRFQLLESVRGFALEQVMLHDEGERVGRAHAQYYLALAERAEPELFGQGRRTWFLRLEDTQDNLRAALEWLLDHDDGEAALRLATALGPMWDVRGHRVEGRRWLEAALASTPTAAPALRAKGLIWLGATLVLSTDRTGTAVGHEAAHAEKVLNDGMELARSAGDRVSAARALTWLGVLSLRTGDWDGGRRILQEAKTSWQEAEHDYGSIQVVGTLGMIAFLQGCQGEALQLMDEVLSRDGGDDWARGMALLFSLNVIATRGDVPRAATMEHELLELSMESQSGRLLYLAAVGAAWLARDHGHPEWLGRLLGAAESIEQATGLVASVMQPLFVAPARETLQTRMGQEDLAAALRAGRHLSFPQVAALIREVLDQALQEGTPQEPEGGRDQAGLLSQRELEVLQLVAEGLSNKQIAHELIIAESTVRYHLTSIFNKLGVDTRTHALAVATQRGLIQLGQTP